MRETMKNIIYTLLVASIVASCADVPEEYSDTNTLSKTNDLQYIDIANAKSLYISSSTGSGRTSSKGYGGKAEDKIFKITDDGGVEEVEYKDGDNKTHTIINSPIAIDVVDDNYIVFSFGSDVSNPNSCYLTNKETGVVYVLGKSLNDTPTESKCPLPQSNSRDKKILTDGKSNLYYRYYGGEDGSRYSIRQVNYSNPKNIVATQITKDDESVEHFVVDSRGNIAYNTLPSTNSKVFWIGFDGEIKYNDTDVNLTSGHYKLYQDDKLIIFDPMGNGKYIIDNGEELVTKELTNSLLIDFLLEIKCKHTFECLTQ
tara:strand:- start:653 stop:1594 length:942 start_codon:yes stop_codon:yes gene_type:complete